MRREPKHVARPDPEFATCREIARTLTATTGLASSQKYRMPQLLEGRTFSMISSHYKMQRGVLHVTVRRGRARFLNNLFRIARPRPVTLILIVNAHDDRVMIRHSRSGPSSDSQCGASKIPRKVVSCAPCLKSAVKQRESRLPWRSVHENVSPGHLLASMWLRTLLSYGR